jgi:acetyl esterase/lipase
MSGMSTPADRRPDDVLTRPSAPAPTTRSYGPDRAQVYDVVPPAAGVPPRGVTLLVVHGGFWRAEYDRAHALPEANAFAAAGYAVALAEYRRTGMPGGGVPGTLDDVRSVTEAVARDPSLPHRVVLVGHSAGGQLVTWAAGQPWVGGLGVVGVVSLAGVVDLDAADRLHLGSDAARAFVGTGPGTPAWRSADPMDALPPRVPVRLLSGTEDDDVPTEVGDAYLESARRAGGDVERTVVPDAAHYAFIDPDEPAFDRVLATVAALTG